MTDVSLPERALWFIYSLPHL